jgi:hypothetical protein
MTEAAGAWELELLKPKEVRKSARLFADQLRSTRFRSRLFKVTSPDDSKRIKLGDGVGR